MKNHLCTVTIHDPFIIDIVDGFRSFVCLFALSVGLSFNSNSCVKQKRHISTLCHFRFAHSAHTVTITFDLVYFNCNFNFQDWIEISRSKWKTKSNFSINTQTIGQSELHRAMWTMALSQLWTNDSVVFRTRRWQALTRSMGLYVSNVVVSTGTEMWINQCFFSTFPTK